MSTWRDHRVPGIWLNIKSVCVCVRVFLDKSASESVDSVRQFVLPKCIMHLVEGLNRTKRRRKEEIWPFLLYCLSQGINRLLSGLLVLRSSNPDWNPYYQCLWFLDPQIWTELHHWHSWISNLQTADCKYQYINMNLSLVLFLYRIQEFIATRLQVSESIKQELPGKPKENRLEENMDARGNFSLWHNSYSKHSLTPK